MKKSKKKKDFQHFWRIKLVRVHYCYCSNSKVAMAAKTGSTKKAAEEAVNAFVEVVTDSLKKGEKVQLVGFGSFEVRKRAARKGRNPQTKEEIKIPASKAPVFKAGKALKDLVNKK